ncbi:MAG: class I SAM-dependent methyltransferase [Thermodesulfobacteriota bacterium]
MTAVFGAYADYYDALNAGKDYEAEAERALELAAGHAGHPCREILDLGCGTGGHVWPLARRGCRVTGVDRSAPMLAVAAGKALDRAAAPPVFHRGDITSLRLGSRFDLVLSLFHVLSYQITDTDLRGVFATAAAHLRPGGLFLFDFWYGPAVLHLRPAVRSREAVLADALVRRTARPTVLAGGHVVAVEFTLEVFGREDGRLRRRLRETHQLRPLFVPEIEGLLEGVGMKALAMTEWPTGGPPGEETWSVCCLARRER